MTKYLAFYKVGNSLGYERHTFDRIDDNKEILNMLNKLPDDELHIYDISHSGYGTPSLSIADLVEDYNNEELDGGWWVVYFAL